MTKLFIDTHSEKVTVAILKDGNIYKKDGISNRSHSEIVMPLLDELLKEAEIEVTDVQEVVVVNGPGSFTGVRIGVTIAKTIAYSLNISIKVISSLEMFGVCANEDFDIATVEDAKGVYSARKTDDGYVDFMYQRKAEFLEYVQENNFIVLKERMIDCEKIFKYMETKESCNPHTVNPIYVKEIDALK